MCIKRIHSQARNLTFFTISKSWESLRFGLSSPCFSQENPSLHHRQNWIYMKLFLKYFIDILERKTSKIIIPPAWPILGIQPQPRDVPWQENELATSQCMGLCTINWATPTRAKICNYFLKHYLIPLLFLLTHSHHHSGEPSLIILVY